MTEDRKNKLIRAALTLAMDDCDAHDNPDTEEEFRELVMTFGGTLSMIDVTEGDNREED